MKYQIKTAENTSAGRSGHEGSGHLRINISLVYVELLSDFAREPLLLAFGCLDVGDTECLVWRAALTPMNDLFAGKETPADTIEG